MKKKQFTVFVDDNFHYQDESERYEHSKYETYAEAVAVCKGIVDQFLDQQLSEGKPAAELYDYYVSFGEDPHISPPQQGESFSAWEYAKKRCDKLCKGF